MYNDILFWWSCSAEKVKTVWRGGLLDLIPLSASDILMEDNTSRRGWESGSCVSSVFCRYPFNLSILTNFGRVTHALRL